MNIEHSQELINSLGTKLTSKKFKCIGIISSISSDHNAMKLEINHRKINEKKPTTWRIKNLLLKKKWVIEDIKKEAKKYLKTSDNEYMATANLWNATK